MPEADPKITAQAKQHLKIYKSMQNPNKHLKWSKNECLAKGDQPRSISERYQKIFDRDVSNVELMNIPGL